MVLRLVREAESKPVAGVGGFGIGDYGAVSINNSGTISGGLGGENTYGFENNKDTFPNLNGPGGVGLMLKPGNYGATVTNSGTIEGGAGSVGGVGADLYGNATLTVAAGGLVTGGAGDYGPTTAAEGIYLDGGTLITSAMIATEFSCPLTEKVYGRVTTRSV